MKNFWKCGLLSLAFSASLGWAQTDEAKPQDQKPPEDEKTEEVAAPKLNRIEVGFDFRNFNGNRNLLNRYSRPIPTFDLREFRWVSPSRGNDPDFKISLRGTPDLDNMQNARLVLLGGRLIAKGAMTQARYDGVNPAVDVDGSMRTSEASLKYQINPKVAAYWAYRGQAHNRQFLSPKPNRDSISKTFSGGVSGSFGNTYGGLSYTESGFFDRTGFQPDTWRKTLAATLGVTLGALDLEGAYMGTTITQDPWADSSVKTWKLNGDWDFGPNSTLALALRSDDISTPNALKDTVRKRLLTSLRLNHQFNPNMNFELGFQRRDVERLRADGTFVDVPSWDTWNARLRGRMNDNWGYAASWNWEHARQGAGMVTTDPRALYWDDRVKGHLGVAGGSGRWSGYAGWDVNYVQNSDRGVSIYRNLISLGGSFVLTDATSASFELSNETFKANGLADELGYNGDDFFPNVTSLYLGVDHVLPRGDRLSAGLTQIFTSSTNPLKLELTHMSNTEFTLRYSTRPKADQSLDIFFAPWTYRDRDVPSFGYRSTLLGLNWSVRF